MLFPQLLFVLEFLTSTGVPCCVLAHTASSIVTRIGSFFLASQHLGAIFCYGYGVLEVGAVAPIDGYGSPAVLEHTNFGAAGVDHGLDGEDQACLEAVGVVGGAAAVDLGGCAPGAVLLVVRAHAA